VKLGVTGELHIEELGMPPEFGIGEPGKAEKAWLASASGEEKAAWNKRKQELIHERKQRVVDEVSAAVGVKVKAQTVAIRLKALHAGARLIVVDPRRTRTAEAAAKGRYELFKTSDRFDARAHHPEWLG
jgi:hypothetical protein